MSLPRSQAPTHFVERVGHRGAGLDGKVPQQHARRVGPRETFGDEAGTTITCLIIACYGHFKLLTVKYFFSLQLEEKLKEQTEELKKADNRIK